jgi:hypothetical protein
MDNHDAPHKPSRADLIEEVHAAAVSITMVTTVWQRGSPIEIVIVECEHLPSLGNVPDLNDPSSATDVSLTRERMRMRIYPHLSVLILDSRRLQKLHRLALEEHLRDVSSGIPEF